MTKRVLGVAIAALLATGAAQAATVTVEFHGVEARGGKFLASLASRAEFLRVAKHGKVVDAPGEGTLTMVFENVEPGEYAVSAHHDEDGDGQFRMNGYMPAEGFAFSGPPMMGPPDFDAQKVTVPAEGATVRVVVIYPPR